jgi:hypothetical protein
MAFISNGTTILDNGAFQASLGNLVLISEQTASSSASVSFTTGIDSTYPIYKFEFIDIHAGSEGANFEFQGSTDGGSSYGVTLTSTFFRAVHGEDGSSGTVSYETDKDLAQSTSFQRIGHSMSTNSKACLVGTLFLFNPSSTTFVKHFMARGSVNYAYTPGYEFDANVAGYFNTTSAVNAIQFKMSSGNIDSGTIKLYGIKDS